MSKIKNYGLDSLLTGTEKLIGSDSDSSGTTKNYSINSISDYIYTDLDIGRLANTSGTNTGDQDLSDYVDKTTNQTIGGLKIFTQDVTINGGIYADNSLGTSGQILSSTGNGIEWVNSAGGGAGLEGTQYIYVQANGTDTENATELQAAYNTAKTMSPSATNRITVVAGIGNYDFGTSSFDMDTEYIDLVSLDGNRSVIFNHTLNTSDRTEGSINITANDVFVKGVDVEGKNFTIANNLNLLKIENCKGGYVSFGGQGIVSGTFTNCQGGDSSFGGFEGIASGTFTNCLGGNDSFGGGGIASGTFTDCKGGDVSFGSRSTGVASGTFTNCQGVDGAFGGSSGVASGTFTNCQGGDVSFGGFEGIASGTFKDCKSGFNSFGGGEGTAEGTFTNCQGGNGSFGGDGTAEGIFTNCIGGIGSFGGFSGTFQTGTASGTFANCQGGDNSFGGNGGTAPGTFTNCQGGNESFGFGGTASGTFRDCVGGEDSFGSLGIASGTFTNCTGGVDSFGGVNGILEGKLYYCRLTSGAFQTVSGTGVTRLCIDGNNNENNQG